MILKLDTMKKGGQQGDMSKSVGLSLGSLTLDVSFFQASLSGYSNYAMRTLARRFGYPFTMAGMMLAKSAAHPPRPAQGWLSARFQ